MFVMIDAYLDESGIHDKASICVIAGYFSGRGQWRGFERDWRILLSRFEVPMEKVHAKDLFPKPSGFFLRWKDARHNPGELVNEMANVIAQHKIYPIAAAVIVRDFQSFSLKQRRFLTGATLRDGQLITSGSPSKPYFVPFQRCMRKIACYTRPNDKAAFFFGLGRPFAGYATSLFNEIKRNPVNIACKERIGNAAFPLAKETPQLQAADLLVNLTYHHMLERHSEDDWNVLPAGPLAKCLRHARNVDDFIFLDRVCLQAGLDITYEVSGRWDQ